MIRVFVVPPMSAPGLQEEAGKFLDALLVRRDLDAATSFFSESASLNDKAWLPPSAIKNTQGYWEFTRDYKGQAVPVDRAEVIRAWKHEFNEYLGEFRIELEKKIPQPKTLPEALSRLEWDGPFYKKLRQDVGSSFMPIQLGDRLLSFHVQRNSDIAWLQEDRSEDIPLAWKTTLAKTIRDQRLEMRAVVGVRRYMWMTSHWALEVYTLWAREGNTWKLWGVAADDIPVPNGK